MRHVRSEIVGSDHQEQLARTALEGLADHLGVLAVQVLLGRVEVVDAGIGRRDQRVGLQAEARRHLDYTLPRQ